MNIKSWFRNYRKKQESFRRSRILRKIERLSRKASPLGDIRQFLYLDELALRSLYISRFGPEDAKTTLTQTRTKDLGLTLGGGASISHLNDRASNGRSSISFRSGKSRALQIEQVSSEQSLFRDFVSRESYAGKESQIWDGVPQSSIQRELLPGRLHRGQLIQVRIRLEAHSIYAYSTIANALVETSANTPALGISQDDTFIQAAQLIQQMLIGQIPINSELVDWDWDEEASTLIRRSDDKANSPIRLVGLTQLDNYWGDVRGFLFDQSECIALVRVSQDTPSTSWSPLKLFDAARGLPGFDGFDTKISELNSLLSGKQKAETPLSDAVERILSHYLQIRTDNEELKVQLEPRVNEIAQMVPNSSQSQLNDAFNQIDVLLSSSGSTETTPDEIGNLRSKAIKLGRGTGAPLKSEENVLRPPNDDSDLYLVGDIIALYW
ncbi:DUF6414 family protein [Corynebacterium rhinophilum]|uniref:DUF6414 family protein n=1 Tax=Corynebacterium rhinophilum TaxID=3050197 RepID=UPI00254B1294|nr:MULTISPECIES: hypothetical protein [unclassified Corynebacterium]MDK8703461.1 hypothetical protein [Corynebacterium sp. MSK107]MDK8705609.1 hypothetical protein [Corynebacterium sp. MSK090]